MAKTALLIIDMQNVFISMTKTALPNVIRLSDFFRKHDLNQIFTQHGHSKEELAPPFTNQLVKKWGVEGSIAIGTHDFDLIPAIRTAQEDAAGENPIVRKNTYDAFLNTPLETILKQRKIERVVICGVMTDCCCDTTGRSAFNRGFETWMVSDATGSANQEQHMAGLKAFEFAFGKIITTTEVIKALEQESGRSS
jgi:nicotinamidase-related amidase